MSEKILRCEILEDQKDFSKLETEWNCLCEALKSNVTVFASFAWYQSWWRFYGNEAKLHIFTMWQGDKLVGLAPLMRSKASIHGLPVKMIGFMQNNQSLHNDFIVMPEWKILFLEKLIQALFEKSSRCDVLYFRNISTVSDNYSSLLEVLEAGGRSWQQNSNPIDSPYLIVDGGWANYLARRSSRTRKSLRNIKNKIRAAGEVSVKNLRTWEEFLACKDDLFAVAQQSWTEKLGDSLGSAINRKFFESLAFSAAEKGWLSIWALYLDGKMIAVEFHLQAYGREHALRGHYHPDVASLSPGAYLEMTILEHVFEADEGIQVYDFCGSFDRYKQKWTDSFVPHCDLYVFNEQMYSKCVKFHEFKTVPSLRRVLQSAKLLRQTTP